MPDPNPAPEVQAEQNVCPQWALDEASHDTERHRIALAWELVSQRQAGEILQLKDELAAVTKLNESVHAQLAVAERAREHLIKNMAELSAGYDRVSREKHAAEARVSELAAERDKLQAAASPPRGAKAGTTAALTINQRPPAGSE